MVMARKLGSMIDENDDWDNIPDHESLLKEKARLGRDHRLHRNLPAHRTHQRGHVPQLARLGASSGGRPRPGARGRQEAQRIFLFERKKPLTSRPWNARYLWRQRGSAAG